MVIVFEAHATTVDNEADLASGWNDVKLSKTGEDQAREMGQRYKLQDLDAIFCSDMRRAYDTARLAFPAINPDKLFLDWRLRECNYGAKTLAPKTEVDVDRVHRIEEPFEGGESYTQAMERMKSFIDDLHRTDFKRILIIGSRATHFGLDVWLGGRKLQDLFAQKMIWQPGWTYELTPGKKLLIDVCGAVIKQDGKYLLIQEKKPSVYGKWNLPGGHRDAQETKEAAAKREVLEETGYEIKILKQLASFPRPARSRVLHAYLAEIKSGAMRPQEGEILDVGWFSSDEIIAMESELRDSEYVLGAIKAAQV